MKKGEQLNELALFAGAGGGILGGHLLGWRTICAVEWEPYPASVLIARQNDGILPSFPIWDDVQTFDGRPWRGRVDVISGGFPCTNISAAGDGTGIDGEASSMWEHMARIIGEVRPSKVYVENSSLLVGRGLTRVLSDLAQMGYDAEWGIMGAHHVASPHQRDRIWIVAYPKSKGLERRSINTSSVGEKSWSSNIRSEGSNGLQGRRDRWWYTEPNVGRVAHGVAARVDRIKAIGNGQVPAVAELAWETLNK